MAKWSRRKIGRRKAPAKRSRIIEPASRKHGTLRWISMGIKGGPRRAARANFSNPLAWLFPSRRFKRR